MIEPINTSSINSNIIFEYISLLKLELIIITKGEVLTANNLLLIIPKLMMSAASYSNLDGSKKKELIVCVLRDFILQSSDIPVDLKPNMLAMFDITIPVTIDLLVAASKSEYVFKIKKKLFKCCS